MPHKGSKYKGKEAKKVSRKDSNSDVPGQVSAVAVANADVPVRHDEEGAVGGEQPADEHAKNVPCCVPSGCEFSDKLINIDEPVDAVKVACNNDQCDQSGWMHHNCFVVWEESILMFLRSCGRARSWSEKQRLQNLWTKKGYDLAYKACDCACARGHLRKDLNYFPKPIPIVSKKKHHKKNNDLPTLTVRSKSHHTAPQTNNNYSGNGNSKAKEHKDSTGSMSSNNSSTSRERRESFESGSFRERVNSTSSIVYGGQHDTILPRNRASSIGSQYPKPSVPISAARNYHCSSLSMTSTGSSPPNSSNSMESSTSSSPDIPCTPISGKPFARKSKFNFNDPVTVVNGCTFSRRQSLNAFASLPRHKQNPYHIKMEDESQHGNDDTHNFLLSRLSTYKATNVYCLLCRNTMQVFDKYPLIDGTFFLSPTTYDEVVSYPVEIEDKNMHLHAICIHCLEGAVHLICQFCKHTWDGSTLLLGTMYSYDIFAASACCEKRYTCKNCSAPLLGPLRDLRYFSEYSHKLQCQLCHCEDHHFVKPLQELYYVQSICK